jgi:hypothetical protein
MKEIFLALCRNLDISLLLLAIIWLSVSFGETLLDNKKESGQAKKVKKGCFF